MNRGGFKDRYEQGEGWVNTPAESNFEGRHDLTRLYPRKHIAKIIIE